MTPLTTPTIPINIVMSFLQLLAVFTSFHLDYKMWASRDNITPSPVIPNHPHPHKAERTCPIFCIISKLVSMKMWATFVHPHPSLSWCHACKLVRRTTSKRQDSNLLIRRFNSGAHGGCSHHSSALFLSIEYEPSK